MSRDSRKPDGLAGFIAFVLLSVVLFLIYHFAQLVIPALLVTFLILTGAFIPFHAYSKATLQARAWKRIWICRQRIERLERCHAPQEEIIPLKRRLRESAQALADHSLEQHRLLLRKAQSPGRRAKLRTLRHDLERLRLVYHVVPNPHCWSRLLRLYLEWDCVRWLVDHPGPARFIVLAMVAILTAVIVVVLPKISAEISILWTHDLMTETSYTELQTCV